MDTVTLMRYKNHFGTHQKQSAQQLPAFFKLVSAFFFGFIYLVIFLFSFVDRRLTLPDIGWLETAAFALTAGLFLRFFLRARQRYNNGIAAYHLFRLLTALLLVQALAICVLVTLLVIVERTVTLTTLLGYSNFWVVVNYVLCMLAVVGVTPAPPLGINVPQEKDREPIPKGPPTLTIVARSRQQGQL